MPSKYSYKKRGKTQNYSPEALEKAVNAVKNGQMSVRKASEAFQVPKSTIGDRISGKHELHVPNGRPPAVPREIEQQVVDAVKMAARRGIGLTRKQILARTNTLYQRLNIKSSYSTFKAGKDWWEGVKRRHPDITLRKPEKLTTTRARMVNREVLGRYFKDLGTIVEELNLNGMPHHIWNCDEMAKNFEHDPVRVVAEKGAPCLGRTSSKSTNITIMACVSASGQRMPPMFIVKGKTSRSLHGFNTAAAPIHSRWCYQKNGWINDVIGERWFNDVFLQFCGPERPQLLILDSHSSHESLAILMRAMQENIHILALPPHTTHLLQPLDKAVFGAVNKKYNEACSEFIQSNPLHQINKWSFPALFCDAWDNAVTPSNIRSGFRACGIYPLDKNVISERAYCPSEPTDLKAPSYDYSSPENADVSPISSTSTCVHVQSQLKSNLQMPNDVQISCPDQVIPACNNQTTVQPALLEVPCKETLLNDDIPSSTTCTSNFVEEPNMSFHESVVSDILDISDPNQLLNLISSGEFLVEPLRDENHNEVVVKPVIGCPGSSPSTSLEVQDPDIVTHTINDTFLPNSIELPIIRKKTNINTSHRLLTSDEIIAEKITAQNIKIEKERKRELKAKKNVKSCVKRIKKEK